MSVPLILPDIFASLSSVVAAHSTRRGGVSAPPYDTLNLGRHVGDDPALVDENRRRYCAALQVDPARLVTANQVHGGEVRTVNAPQHAPGCDGLVTDRPNLLLTITVADCAAVLFANPDAGVVGACHSGWRGTVAGVVENTFDAMADRGATPDATRAYVGPCIAVDSFEVGPEVADTFAEQFGPDVVHTREVWRRPHVDLKAAIRQQLDALGLRGDHIEISPHDTYAENDTFFSYRRHDGPVGSLVGSIGLVS